jgi:hypothetical protein
LAAFELVLMSKTWSPATAARILDFRNDAQAEAAPLPDAPN